MKNESVKKSLEKSKNVLEEKRHMAKRKICIKKTNVYNNCYELRSRAINNVMARFGGEGCANEKKRTILLIYPTIVV